MRKENILYLLLHLLSGHVIIFVKTDSIVTICFKLYIMWII